MMSLTKCYFELTSYMKTNEEFGEFWQILFEEYALSKKMLLKITEQNALMSNELRSKQSIQIRDEIVRPLLLIQHYALQILNSKVDETNNEVYEK